MFININSFSTEIIKTWPIKVRARIQYVSQQYIESFANIYCFTEDLMVGATHRTVPDQDVILKENITSVLLATDFSKLGSKAYCLSQCSLPSLEKSVASNFPKSIPLYTQFIIIQVTVLAGKYKSFPSLLID